ncbi:MAG: CDP-archaeol synthase [Bacteriovoracaceae bacterium]
MFPLIISGIAHMLVVKKNSLSFLKIPINEKAFGANKTWRGIIVMPIFALICILFIDYLENAELIINHGFKTTSAWLGGPLLGLAYSLFELPNSFIKRRLKIPPGKLASDHKFMFFFLDHLDSATGCILVYHFVFNFPWWILLSLIPFAIIIHTLINLLLYALKIRQNPF